MVNPAASTFNKDLVLHWFMNYLEGDQRAKLINALPEAYNDIVGRNVATVVRTEYLPKVETFP